MKNPTLTLIGIPKNLLATELKSNSYAPGKAFETFKAQTGWHEPRIEIENGNLVLSGGEITNVAAPDEFEQKDSAFMKALHGFVKAIGGITGAVNIVVGGKSFALDVPARVGA